MLVDAHLSSSGGMHDLKGQLNNFTSTNCSDVDDHHADLESILTYGNKQLELKNTKHLRIGERIVYTIPWTGSSIATNELLVKPAHRITETTKEPSSSSVEGRVVIIGASFQR